MHFYLVWHTGDSAHWRGSITWSAHSDDFKLSFLSVMRYRQKKHCLHFPPPCLSLSSSHAEQGRNLASQHKSYRDTIFEGDSLQGVAVCNPMLNEFLPQGRCDAGGAAVRADLRPGQTLGQFALWLGTRPGPREDGLAESSSSIPHRQDGRKLRHLLLNK